MGRRALDLCGLVRFAFLSPDMPPYDYEKVLLYTPIGSTQLFKGKPLQPPIAQIAQCL